tara:strand:+ start:758 stop:1798 length:1041 start_codon:yes stop_codon:yes gene_type:complete
MCTKLKKLREKIESYEEPPSVGIIMHANPDPDCMGAACGMERLIKSINPECQCTLIYSGEISHPQNKTMVNVLNLTLTHRDDIEKLEDVGEIFITVDVLPERCNMKEVPCFLAVDHHKADTKKAENKDIRQVGSTSAIIWEYLQDAEINLDSSEEDAIIATALAIGIRTDTQELTENASEIDFLAYQDLMKKVNQREFKAINNYPIPPYHFELRKRLDQEENMIVDSGVFYGGIGYVPPSKRDALATIADERSRVEGTDTAFVFAMVGDFIEVSVRSNGVSTDVNVLCQNIFGKDMAGGKSGAGAAKIPMGYLSVADDEIELQDVMWKAVRLKLFTKIKEEMSKHR